MKKFLSLLLLAGTTGALLAQNAPAGNQPRETQPIVVDNSSAAAATVKTVVTKKAYTATRTEPETVVTVTAPDRSLEKEAILTWVSIGLRSSLDYHLDPAAGSLSCLWLFGEWYTQNWGMQLGVGYLYTPIATYTDGFNNTYTGTGTRGNVTLDLLGKWYFPFWRVWWIGGGANYAALLGGQLRWLPAATATTGNNATNPADATVATYPRWADVTAGGGIFYLQVGTGFKIAIGNGFNTVNFEPEFRALIPVGAPNGYGIVLRFNAGFSYAFNI